MSTFGASVLVSNYSILVESFFGDSSSILELFISLSAAALSMSVLLQSMIPGFNDECLHTYLPFLVISRDDPWLCLLWGGGQSSPS